MFWFTVSLWLMTWQRRFFFYISRSSLMSSFSSPVKTSSQQFRSVCLSEILGISHDMYIHAIFLGIPFLLLLTHSVLWDQFIALGCTLTALYYFLLHESWQVLQGIPSESVLLQWFFNFLCHVIMIATYWTQYLSNSIIHVLLSITFFKECFMHLISFMRPC